MTTAAHPTVRPPASSPAPFRAAGLDAAVAAPPRGVTCHQPPWGRRASAAAGLVLARWVTPDLPLYGDDHDRGDFAP